MDYFLNYRSEELEIILSYSIFFTLMVFFTFIFLITKVKRKNITNTILKKGK